MEGTTVSFPITNYGQTKLQLLYWASRFSSCSFLDNHQYKSHWNGQECLVAAGAIKILKANSGLALLQLQAFIDENQGEWLFGHLSYDLKNEIEALQSVHPNNVGFPDLCFYIPEIVVQLNETQASISTRNDDHAKILDHILQTPLNHPPPSLFPKTELSPVMSKEEYLEIIGQLTRHILRGDCYEINFCQEFRGNQRLSDPVHTFRRLCDISPNPFSVFYRVDASLLLCASPERYLLKQDRQVLSQPIKGTAARHPDESLDQQAANRLLASQKEKSENVMVVDLVRNDLSRVCEEGSVKVTELFGIYSYPQVHQMISTITGTLRAGISFTDIIRATYPMGSMTGAPKKRVMELIDRYERSRRGLFSGSVGYISPTGDFDFNVVIRSIFYNSDTHYLSYQVGGGITAYSEPEKEYEECRLKAGAIRDVLGFND